MDDGVPDGSSEVDGVWEGSDEGIANGDGDNVGDAMECARFS